MATSFYQVKNNAKTTITNNPLTAGGLSITLASSTGSKFPTTGNTWLGTIWDAVTYSDPSDDPNMEIVLIDSRSTDTLTVNASGRGFAGTTGVSHATGSAFRLLFTKEHADQWSTAINTLEARPDVGTYTPWTDWTPTLTNITKGSGTIAARYTQIGKIVHYYLKVTLAADSSVSSGPRFSLPVATSSSFSGLLGYARLVEAGVATREGRASFVDVNTAEIYAFDASATYLTAVAVSATIPFVWGTADLFIVHGSYEAA